jgi:nitrite reductase (NO-forming)
MKPALLASALLLSIACAQELQSTPAQQATAAPPAAVMQRGQQIYQSYCKTCHQANGQGIPGVYPPLAKADYLKDKQATIRAVVFGLSGKIVVNGKTYNGVMPPAPYNDADIAAVLTYVYNSFGNSGGIVTAQEVAAVRKAGKPGQKK